MTGRGDGEGDDDPDDAPGKKGPPATEALRDPPDSDVEVKRAKDSNQE